MVILSYSQLGFSVPVNIPAKSHYIRNIIPSYLGYFVPIETPENKSINDSMFIYNRIITVLLSLKKSLSIFELTLFVGGSIITSKKIRNHLKVLQNEGIIDNHKDKWYVRNGWSILISKD